VRARLSEQLLGFCRALRALRSSPGRTQVQKRCGVSGLGWLETGRVRLSFLSMSHVKLSMQSLSIFRKSVCHSALVYFLYARDYSKVTCQAGKHVTSKRTKLAEHPMLTQTCQARAEGEEGLTTGDAVLQRALQRRVVGRVRALPHRRGLIRCRSRRYQMTPQYFSHSCGCALLSHLRRMTKTSVTKTSVASTHYQDISCQYTSSPLLLATYLLSSSPCFFFNNKQTHVETQDIKAMAYALSHQPSGGAAFHTGPETARRLARALQSRG